MFVVHDQLQNCWSTVPVSALGDLKAKICHHDKRPGLAPRLFFCSIFLLWISCNKSATALVSATPFFGLDRGPSRLRHCRLYKFGAHFNKPQTFFSWSNIIVPLCPLSYPRGTTKLTLGSYPILKLDFSSAQWLVCCKPLFGSIGSISRAQPCLHRLFRRNLNQSQQKRLKFESFKMVQNGSLVPPFFGGLKFATQHIYAQSLPAALHAHICRTRTAGTVCHAKWVLLTDTWRLRVWALEHPSDVQKSLPGNVVVVVVVIVVVVVVIMICVKWY